MEEHDLLVADIDEQLKCDEAALIERIRKGEKELFHELIQRTNGAFICRPTPSCETSRMPKRLRRKRC